MEEALSAWSIGVDIETQSDNIMQVDDDNSAPPPPPKGMAKMKWTQDHEGNWIVVPPPPPQGMADAHDSESAAVYAHAEPVE
eukprot:4890485-Amphidinium_carterae.1